MTAPIMNEWDTPEPVLPQKVPFPLEVIRANLRTEARNTVLGGLALVGFAFVVAIIRHDWSLNFCSVGVLGLLGFAFIDNGAHFGGLICGLWFGWLCFRNNGRWIRDHEKLIKVSGAVSVFG